MKTFFTIALVSATLVLSGCGGTDEPSNIMEGVDPAALQEYEDLVAADEAAMPAEDSSGGTGEVAETPDPSDE